MSDSASAKSSKSVSRSRTRPKKAANFVTYINRLLHNVDDEQSDKDKSITGSSLDLINNLVLIFGKRLTENATTLVTSIKKAKTINDVVVDYAALIVLPQSLDFLRGEAKEAVRTYDESADVQGDDGKKQTRAARAELIFPPPRAETLMRTCTPSRISENASVYLAGLLEALAYFILANCVRYVNLSGRVRITPNHVQRTLQSHAGLAALFPQNDVITGHGPAPLDSLVADSAIIKQADDKALQERQGRQEKKRRKPKAAPAAASVPTPSPTRNRAASPRASPTAARTTTPSSRQRRK